MLAGICGSVWYPTGDGVWVPTANSRRGQQSPLAMCVCVNVCMYMHVASCPLSQRPAGCKPFICSIIQPEAIPFDTHIPHGTLILPSWQHSALWPDGRVSFKTPALPRVPWHMQISSWYASPSCIHISIHIHILCYARRVPAVRHLNHLMP